MKEVAVYTIPSPASDFFKVVHEDFAIRLEALPSSVETFYDTFDWRIFRAGGVLCSIQAGAFRSLTLEAKEKHLSCRLEEDWLPGFVWELPGGVLREQLTPIVKMRRFLPIVHVERTGLLLHVLGAEEKTVARMRLLDSTVRVPGEASHGALPSTLEIIPIKGYETAFKKIMVFIEGKPGLSRDSADSLHRAVRAVNIVPGAYNSKFSVHLDTSMTAGEAAIRIFKTLLDSMLINQEGMLLDLDSEFLHDFRVAVRRTRSALSQIKKVFPKDRVEHFGKEFAWLGRKTGPERDLDVYLLKMDDYRSLLPESVREDLEPLYEFLNTRKRDEHKLLVNNLRSARYKRLIDDWRQYLDSLGASETLSSKAFESVIDVSSKRIGKVYRRILEKGSSIDNQSPATALHSLRIDCKNLRYLLEFFKSLYNPGEIRQLVKALRMLQDNLGDFNDYEVQQVTLKRFAQTMSEEGKGSVDTLMAMGRLIEKFELEQRKERARFSKRFKKFSSSVNQQRFRALFSNQKVATRS